MNLFVRSPSNHNFTASNSVRGHRAKGPKGAVQPSYGNPVLLGALEMKRHLQSLGASVFVFVLNLLFSEPAYEKSFLSLYI